MRHRTRPWVQILTWPWKLIEVALAKSTLYYISQLAAPEWLCRKKIWIWSSGHLFLIFQLWQTCLQGTSSWTAGEKLLWNVSNTYFIIMLHDIESSKTESPRSAEDNRSQSRRVLFSTAAVGAAMWCLRCVSQHLVSCCCSCFAKFVKPLHPLPSHFFGFITAGFAFPVSSPGSLICLQKGSSSRNQYGGMSCFQGILTWLPSAPTSRINGKGFWKLQPRGAKVSPSVVQMVLSSLV